MLLLVYIAHNGKTLELDVLPSTRVDELQGTLASLTGLRAGEQIVMCDGRPLDPGQLLSAYKLPVDEVGTTQDVFLYCKSHLRSAGEAPEPESLEPINVDEPVPGSIQYEVHPLDAAPSPLLRALPAYEREFRAHVSRGRAFSDAAEARLAVADQLLAEMNVQGMAIDAARSNVEHHYNYIQDACLTFMSRYHAQAAAHQEVLGRFERDMDALAAAELHPAARTGGAARLLDLLPEAKLRDWAGNCGRAHSQFADKVAELEGLFGALRADVEALFMQAPSADMDALALRARDMRLHAAEQASIAAALESDFARVQGLVEEAVRALSARPGAGSVGPLDAAGVMDTMHESHVQELLPRLAAGDAVLARFADRCLECKNQMTLEVVGQLRRISAQQSKISRTRGQLSVFRQVAGRQAEAIAELLLPRRLPAAYRHCLAECLRRKAFGELYAGQAGELAEKMARLRAKEAAARNAFRSAVDRFIPATLLIALGLTAQPPHCEVSVPPPDTGLAPITPEDLKRAPSMPQMPALLAEPFAPSGDTPRTPRSAGASPRPPLSPRAPDSLTASDAAAVSAAAAAAVAQAEAEEASASSPAALELENARLRAELAAQVALACVAEQQAVGMQAAGKPQRGPRAGSSGGSPAESQHASGESLQRSGSGSGGDAAMAARFQEALSAKDDVASRLDRELAASRQQLTAYEARIRALEQRLARSSLLAAGGSASASSRASSAAASASSPVGLLPAAGDTTSAPLPPSLSEISGLAGGGGSSSQPMLDVAQRAASGTFIAPSADKPPRSPRLPPSGSPRGVTFASELPPLALSPPPLDQPSAGTASETAGPPQAPDAETEVSSAEGFQSDTATPASAVQQAAMQDTAPAAAVMQAATATSVPGDAVKAADARPAASDGASVVTSPSLTSLADAAAGAAAAAPSTSTTSTNLAAASATAGPRGVSDESSTSEVAVTSGFCVTGFQVPSTEQAPHHEMAESGESTASSSGGGRHAGGVLAAPEPQPAPPAGGSDTADPAAGIARKESLGHAEVLDAVCASVPLPHPLLSPAAPATDTLAALAVGVAPDAAGKGASIDERSDTQAFEAEGGEAPPAAALSQAATGSEGQASPTGSAVST